MGVSYLPPNVKDKGDGSKRLYAWLRRNSVDPEGKAAAFTIETVHCTEQVPEYDTSMGNNILQDSHAEIHPWLVNSKDPMVRLVCAFDATQTTP